VGFSLVGSFFLDPTLTGEINGTAFSFPDLDLSGFTCDESLHCTGEWTGGKDIPFTNDAIVEWTIAEFDSISSFSVHFSEAKSVPEPASAMLLGTGLIGLLYQRARSSLRV